MQPPALLMRGSIRDRARFPKASGDTAAGGSWRGRAFRAKLINPRCWSASGGDAHGVFLPRLRNSPSLRSARTVLASPGIPRTHPGNVGASQRKEQNRSGRSRRRTRCWLFSPARGWRQVFLSLANDRPTITRICEAFLAQARTVRAKRVPQPAEGMPRACPANYERTGGNNRHSGAKSREIGVCPLFLHAGDV